MDKTYVCNECRSLMGEGEEFEPCKANIPTTVVKPWGCLYPDPVVPPAKWEVAKEGDGR